LVFNPEFLRESSAIRDYDSPPYTVVGTESYLAEQALRKIYEDIKAPIIVVEPEVAEMVKYVANAWHAAKVTFANEVGRISKSFGVDGRSVMDIIVQDKKLNISKAYMKPGFAFGGSCLPKDLSSLIYYAKQNSVSVPFIDSMPTANQAHIRSVAKEILALGSRKIAFLGLAFKPNTDDLRESPNVILIKYLIGEGCSIKIYDPSVHEARLMGTNLAYIRENIPHFENLLMPSLDSALLDCDLIVVSHSTQLFRDVLENISIDSKIKIFDLAGIFDHPLLGVDYYGIAW
jgi:GDP-mannose 6-dehydrogenase